MKIAVIFGGKSDEHEVSRMSAVNVLKGIAKLGDEYEVMQVGITKAGRWYLTEAGYEEIQNGDWEKHPGNRQVTIPSDPVGRGILVFDESDHAVLHKLDCCYPVLHGDFGEDGKIQGVFEMAGIPYVGCGVASSANCMDKALTKTIVECTGVTMAKTYVIKKHAYDIDREGEIARAAAVNGGEFPLFVKPSSAGSSVGATKAHNLEELAPAIDEAFKYDNKVLVEEMIVGREIECAVLGNQDPQASCVGEILAAAEFYDYDAKYNNPDSKTRVIDDLPEEVLNEVRRFAVEIYKALDCRGMSRVDFFYSEDGRIVFNEINNLPGFTNISMYPQLWEAMGVPQPELIRRIINFALEEYEDKIKFERAE